MFVEAQTQDTQRQNPPRGDHHFYQSLNFQGEVVSRQGFEPWTY